ncbi:universal stress protein [Wenjunlia tyrosinilytica]|uniref:Stress-inducible protein n=1 Tax=Wenjunlia tyrosinilytica TaxID=1544741 RepID=A0A918DYE3_9ACTN|nr:universal stress protein [Wenjunlia tyrosinilytica]GGO90482.1 stress-inducible protein [Wenjunlia tyrosinilytica]
MEPVVTVGLDGSPESVTAAHWAAGEARLRHVPLRLVHAWVMAPPATAGVQDADVQDHWATRIVRDAAKELREDFPGLAISEELVAKDPVEALLAEAEHSQVLALGSRGIGPMAHFFLGDIALDVVSRAEQPVVLVRGAEREAGEPLFPGGGNVVVALRLHGPSESLLEFAFEAARRRGAPVRALHSRALPPQAYAPWGVGPDAAKHLADDAREELKKALAPWQRKYPDVRVIEEVALESPARAVVRAASGADLLVMGRRRKSPAWSRRIGTVVHAAIHHATCPVAVVPHD